MSQDGVIRVTMKDVADMAGVSKTTVSHALNSTRHVEDSTRLRIQQAVYNLGYVPNQTARSLKGKGSKIIGIIISDIRESYNAEVVKEIEGGAVRLGYNVMICSSSDNLEDELRSLQLLIQKGMDAIIISPVDTATRFSTLVPAGIPLIQFDRQTHESYGDYIGIDNYESALKAVQILAANGSCRIGITAYNETVYTMQERCRGYREALHSTGQEPLVYYAGSKEHILEDLTLWIKKYKPDALLCGNEHLSCVTCQAVRDSGLKIPEDIKIIGYDDSPWLNLLSSPLTAVRQPAKEIGCKILDTAMARIEGRADSLYQQFIIPSELIIRNSCGSSL